MRYDADEALRLTLERAGTLRRRNTHRRTIALSVGTGGCACALLCFGYSLVARCGAALGEADYGAFLLPSHAGGYILAAVLAFAAGVLVTLLCLRNRKASLPIGRPSPECGEGHSENHDVLKPDDLRESPEKRD